MERSIPTRADPREPSPSRLTHHASRITHHASRLTHHVSRITYHASRITSHVSRLTHHVSRPRRAQARRPRALVHTLHGVDHECEPDQAEAEQARPRERLMVEQHAQPELERRRD